MIPPVSQRFREAWGEPCRENGVVATSDGQHRRVDARCRAEGRSWNGRPGLERPPWRPRCGTQGVGWDFRPCAHDIGLQDQIASVWPADSIVEQPRQQLCGDGKRRVGHYAERCSGQWPVERVRSDDFDSSSEAAMGSIFCQPTRPHGVELDGDDACARIRTRQGQCAAPGADVDNQVTWGDCHRRDESTHQWAVDEEVLSEATASLVALRPCGWRQPPSIGHGAPSQSSCAAW
jgi:hypothetical protein